MKKIDKAIRANELIKEFNLTLNNKKRPVTTRVIKGHSAHRAGLELAGFKHVSAYTHTVIGWGSKEAYYLDGLSNEKAEKAIENVINTKTPLLILSIGFVASNKFKLVEKIANQNKVPLVCYKGHLSSITTQVTSYLIQRQAVITSLHGSLVIVNGVGLAIKGKSGIGKSEAVLELIQKGHTFVSDDTIEAYRLGSIIMGKAADITKGLLEARGIGIINMPFIYGARSVKYETEIELFIELVDSKELNNVDRLGTSNLKETIWEVDIPKIQIPTASGRSIAALIEAAVNVHLARKTGMDPLEEMRGRR